MYFYYTSQFEPKSLTQVTQKSSCSLNLGKRDGLFDTILRNLFWATCSPFKWLLLNRPNACSTYRSTGRKELLNTTNLFLELNFDFLLLKGTPADKGCLFESNSPFNHYWIKGAELMRKLIVFRINLLDVSNQPRVFRISIKEL